MQRLAFNFQLPNGTIVRRQWNDSVYKVYIAERLAFASRDRSAALRFAKQEQPT